MDENPDFTYAVAIKNNIYAGNDDSILNVRTVKDMEVCRVQYYAIQS
jgi:hypothetical protein